MRAIAAWRGKELLVDTCCVKDSIRLPGGGPHSDALRIKERIYAAEPFRGSTEPILPSPIPGDR